MSNLGQMRQPVQPSSNNTLKSASYGLSVASLGANAAVMAAKSAVSGVTQGVNLATIISELRKSFNTQQQSEISNDVIKMLSSLSSRTLAKNNVPNTSPKDIMINKLTAASLEAARSALNGMLNTGRLGKQAFNIVNQHVRGGKTYKRKHYKKHKKTRRRI